MAYLKPQSALKDINSGDYFYPLTTHDQIITGASRLSAFFTENNNKLDLSNIRNITVDGIACFKNQVYINFDQDVTSTTKNGSLIIGDKDGDNVSIDGNEIMARHNGSISPLYLNNEGGAVNSQWIRLINDDSDNSDDALLFVRNYNDKDWSIKIAKSTYNCGLYIQGTGTNLLRVGANNTFNVGDAAVQVNGTALRIVNNGNTLTIGSLNSSWCHFESSANIPFYFNKNVQIYGQMIQYDSAVISESWINGRNSAAVRVSKYNGYHAGLSMKSPNGSWEIGVYTSNNLWFNYCADSNYNAHTNTVAQLHIDSNAHLWGAVWNDYAEMRNVPIANDYKPDGTHSLYAGRCVYENGDDTMSLTFKRLQKGCRVISDTFGFNIGETEKCKTPIAVSGRALVYLLEGRDVAKKSIGEFVCSGPNGTVSIMTLEEYQKYPQAVVGIISAVPDYEVWGTGNIKVNGRIWIYVR